MQSSLAVGLTRVPDCLSVPRDLVATRPPLGWANWLGVLSQAIEYCLPGFACVGHCAGACHCSLSSRPPVARIRRVVGPCPWHNCCCPCSTGQQASCSCSDGNPHQQVFTQSRLYKQWGWLLPANCVGHHWHLPATAGCHMAAGLRPPRSMASRISRQGCCTRPRCIVAWW